MTQRAESYHGERIKVILENLMKAIPQLNQIKVIYCSVQHRMKLLTVWPKYPPKRPLILHPEQKSLYQI